MNNDYVYTALIDVLAYRTRLHQDIQNGEERFKDDLEGALSILDSVNNAVFGVQAISDTIILTCNTHDKFPEFLSLINKIFLSFLEKGLFIRGGIAYSKHFQSGKITYSHAIAKAYELEQNMAIYPRIVIDENILDMYKTGNNLPTIFGKNLILKKNGIAYLNILDSTNWLSTYENAKNIFDSSKDYLQKNEQAYIKHAWFENYLFDSHNANNKTARYIPNHDTL
jgi:hypothetical protein